MLNEPKKNQAADHKLAQDFSRGLKVVQLTGHLSTAAGGFAASVPNLSRALADQRAIKVVVIGIEDANEEYTWKVGDRVAMYSIRSYGPRALGFAPQQQMLINAVAPDLLHSHGLWMYSSLTSSRWRRRAKRPVIISPRGMLDEWALGQSQAKKKAAWLLYERANLRGATALHALNEAEAQAIRRLGLIQPIAIVPNGIDLSVATRTASDDECKTLLFLGRLHAKKGLTELLRAWARVQNIMSYTRWHLSIAGWSNEGYERTLHRLIVDLDLADTVKLLGPCFGRDKETTLRRAHAFVLPSFSEGLPMAVLEAWSHSVPVLMTRACNLPEGFLAGAALEIRPEIDALAESLYQLAMMPADALREMGAAGRRLVETCFTWDAVAQEMSAVYRWLVDGGPPPSCVMFN